MEAEKSSIMFVAYKIFTNMAAFVLFLLILGH